MLRNSEKPYGNGEGYQRHRGPHQNTPGPEQHESVSALALAYVNLLEERIYVLDLELGAMRDRFGHQMDFRNQAEPTENQPDRGSEPKAMAAEPIQHPWDIPVAGKSGIGVTARQSILDMAEQIADLQTQTSNLNLELTAYRKGPGIPPAPEARPTPASMSWMYQSDVRDVIMKHWGTAAFYSKEERALRFMEEAIELAQACYVRPEQLVNIIDWVYSREIGPLDREVGGVMVTLAGVCERNRLDMFAAGDAELVRLQAKEPREMQERHRHKPSSIKSNI